MYLSLICDYLKSQLPARRFYFRRLIQFVQDIYCLLATDPRILCFQTKIPPRFVCIPSLFHLSPQRAEARLVFQVKMPRGVLQLCGNRNSGWNWPSRDNSSSSGRCKWVIIGNCLWRLRHGNCLCIKQIREKGRQERTKGRREREITTKRDVPYEKRITILRISAESIVTLLLPISFYSGIHFFQHAYMK